MKITEVIDSNKQEFADCIKKYGSNAEHNIDYYLNHKTKSSKLMAFNFGNDKIVLSLHTTPSNNWFMLPSAVLCPEEERLSMLLEFIHFCLGNGMGKKLTLEIEEGLYNGLKERINNYNSNLSKLRLGKSFIRSWPIVKLNLWDSGLKGKRWHRLRNIKNKFYKEHDIKIIDSREIPKDALKKIVFDWKQKRKAKDMAYCSIYNKFISNGFRGIDYAKTICVNGLASSIIAGWNIPNTNSLYLSIILHNYNAKGLGEVMYIESLSELQKMNFESVNLGGSDEDLLLFKEKFQPHYNYRTFEFSIKKLKE